jgi:hypothetical protein
MASSAKKIQSAKRKKNGIEERQRLESVAISVTASKRRNKLKAIEEFMKAAEMAATATGRGEM